ncbi:MAG: long-chain fatty acid--CoA ligase, partial [Alphaproteobacteria bacterium]|nr:long-chain fatty acid--CoA ligase [Alphaproteobacteria bacterium]
MSELPWLHSYPRGVDWNAELPVKPLQALLDDARHRFPDSSCCDFLGRRFTFGQIADMAERAATGFQKLGVGKGIKVGLFLPNCPQFIVAYYGILKAGGTVVNYSPLYSEPELLQQVEDSQTDVMVTLDLKLLYPKMAAILRKSRLKTLVVGSLSEVLPFPKSLLYPIAKRRDLVSVPNDSAHLSFRELMHNDGAYAPPSIDPHQDVAVLQYTGGTTGVSKGAMLTHANLYVNTIQTCRWFTNMEPGRERILGVLPFFHVFAMTVVMNQGLYAGAEIIIHPRFDLEAALKDIAAKKPTIMPGVPTMFAAINRHPNLAQYDLRSLKACLSGGAPLPQEVKQRFEQLTGCKLVEGYGLTEASPVVSANPLEGATKLGSIGLPLPGTRIVITDRDDPSRVLPLGEDGEICVEGPQVMAGYWRSAEATAESFRGGRLRTGDVGHMDRDGYTYIIDRIKDLILVGGFNVYPR